jgi:hypothetical protein
VSRGSTGAGPPFSTISRLLIASITNEMEPRSACCCRSFRARFAIGRWIA